MITNELRGQSAFFPRKEQEKTPEDTQPDASLSQSVRKPKQPPRDTVIPRHHDTMQPSNHDTTIPEQEEDMLEIVRKAVKQIGKEAATYRFTVEEKQMLRDIKYTMTPWYHATKQPWCKKLVDSYKCLVRIIVFTKHKKTVEEQPVWIIL